MKTVFLGGGGNPLRARTLYLYQPGRGDTMLRIHGTDRPETLGRAISNGCARLINDQLIEFYELVPLNARVVLYPVEGNFSLLPVEANNFGSVNTVPLPL